MNEVWHDVIAESDFPAGGRLVRIINGWHVLVVKADKRIFVVNDRCTHQASPLSGGSIHRRTVTCPLHGARFDLQTGRNLDGALRPIRTFPWRLIEGRIQVSVPEELPRMEDLPVIL